MWQEKSDCSLCESEVPIMRNSTNMLVTYSNY
jgi:hypothetical protein